jgi:hypothetical protein
MRHHAQETGLCPDHAESPKGATEVHLARSEKWPRKAFLRFYGLCHKHFGFRFAPASDEHSQS